MTYNSKMRNKNIIKGLSIWLEFPLCRVQLKAALVVLCLKYTQRMEYGKNMLLCARPASSQVQQARWTGSRHQAPFSQRFSGRLSSDGQREINQLTCRVGIPQTSVRKALEGEEEVAGLVEKLHYRQIYTVFQLHLCEASRASLFLMWPVEKFIQYFRASFNHSKSIRKKSCRTCVNDCNMPVIFDNAGHISFSEQKICGAASLSRPLQLFVNFVRSSRGLCALMLLQSAFVCAD